MPAGAEGGNLEDRLSAQQLRPQRREGRADSDKAGAPAESALKEWLRLFFKAGFCALLLYQFVFQVFVVRQESMAPNYHEGQWVVVDKLSYRFSPPRRGDVVVFEVYEQDRETGRREYRDILKRIAGEPGDRVRTAGGAVFLDGVRLDEPYVAEGQGAGTDGGAVDECYVPPGHYYVLGDNRRDSRDSRPAGAHSQSLGLIPRERLVGKVRWRCW